MEWIQVFTIIASILGGIYVFYQITKENINRLDQANKENINSLDQATKENINRLDQVIERMDNNHREDVKMMDQKWERLFERLLIQDKLKRVVK